LHLLTALPVLLYTAIIWIGKASGRVLHVWCQYISSNKEAAADYGYLMTTWHRLKTCVSPISKAHPTSIWTKVWWHVFLDSQCR